VRTEDQRSRELFLRGRAAETAGDDAGAQQFYRQALRVVDAAYGPGHSRFGVALLALGTHTIDRDRDEAKLRVAHALAVLAAAHGPEHADTARAMSDLGIIYWLQHDWVRARRWLSRSIPITERTRSGMNPNLAFTRAYLEMSQGDPDEPYENLVRRVEEVLEPLVRLHNPDDHSVALARRMIDHVRAGVFPSRHMLARMRAAVPIARARAAIRFARVAIWTAGVGAVLLTAHVVIVGWYLFRTRVREEVVDRPALAERPALQVSLWVAVAIFVVLVAVGVILWGSASALPKSLGEPSDDSDVDLSIPVTAEGILDDALAIFAEFADGPANLRRLAQRGRADTLWELRRPAEAIRDYDDLLRDDPDDVSTLRARACVWTMNGRFAEAAADLERALELEPDSAFALHRFGGALNALDRHHEASVAYKRALDIDPDNAASWCERGRAFYLIDRNRKALRSLDRALELDETLADAHTLRGTVLAALGKRAKSRQAFKEALRLEPDNATTWYMQGAALVSVGRWEEATVSFGRAIAIAPDDSTYLSRGEAYRMLGRYDEAIADFDEALRRNPGNADAVESRDAADRGRARLGEALADPEGSHFNATVVDALAEAVAQLRPGALLDTRTVLHALMRVDLTNDWGRITTHFGSIDAVGRSDAGDPDCTPGERWKATTLTRTCAEAVRTALRIADNHDLGPVPSGVLALGLVADPMSGAARALGVADRTGHHRLIDLIQEDLLDVELADLDIRP
jgi:tetratricopeptide (TPR) repeat protein